MIEMVFTSWQNRLQVFQIIQIIYYQYYPHFIQMMMDVGETQALTAALIEAWNVERYYAGREILDLDIHEMFEFYGKRFFKNKLNFCTVQWSERLIESAGICVYKGSERSNVIYLSEPLLKFRDSNQLKETLLHEMIHAYLFLTNPRSCQVKGGHGVQFTNMMKQINEVTKLNITVRHYFFDEVQYYKQHVWRCNGQCNQKKPFYGYLRKTTKQPPSMKDNWFVHHQRTCGGEFVKVQEPRRETLDRSYKKKVSKEPNQKRKPFTKKVSKEKEPFNPFKGKGTKLSDFYPTTNRNNKKNTSTSLTREIPNNFVPFGGKGISLNEGYQQPAGFSNPNH